MIKGIALLLLAATLGSAHVPMPWVYTENDQYWGATRPREWVEAFQATGGRAEFLRKQGSS